MMLDDYLRDMPLKKQVEALRSCLLHAERERDEARTVARQKHAEHRFYQRSFEPFPGWTEADLNSDERNYPWLLDPDPNVKVG